jgi:hypothetical protein
MCVFNGRRWADDAEDVEIWGARSKRRIGANIHVPMEGKHGEKRRALHLGNINSHKLKPATLYPVRAFSGRLQQ